MDEDSVALVKDRLTISEVVEVLRDPSKYPVIADPPQRPEAVPNPHVLHVATRICTLSRNKGSKCRTRRAPSSDVQFSCSANFHLIPQIINFTVFLAICSCTQYSRSLSSLSRPEN